MPPATRRLAVATGCLAAAVSVVGIPLATLAAPWFAWPANALSDLGVVPRTALLFNGTIVVTATLGLPYAWAVWDGGRGWERVPAVTLAPSLVLLGGVGVFVAGHPLHASVAVGFYLGLTVTLAAVHVAQWWLWVEGVRVGPGLALPEFVGAAFLAVWVVALSPVAPLGRRASVT